MISLYLNKHILHRFTLFFAILFLANAVTVFAEEVSPAVGVVADDLIEEELRWLRAEAVVFTASRREEKLFETPAAAYVLTKEDIRRSGVTNIPDALRMVPGVNVARIDANKWAISIRGFKSRFANKLLVLIDGRSVYTPFFSGVYWEIQDTILEDVERIEVIRGPGATLWGANAVNGVINIITKNSADTLGTYIEAGGGNEEEGFGSLRYGGQFGESGTYRVYGKFYERDSFDETTVQDTEDDSRLGLVGFRLDLEPSNYDTFMVQGSIFDETGGTTQDVSGTLVNDDIDIKGANFLSRWEHMYSEQSNLRLQFYYDRYDWINHVDELEETRDTFDFELQHNVTLAAIHDVVWGLGYRLSADDIEGNNANPQVTLRDNDQTIDVASVFIQDRIEIVEEKLFLTAGSKVEHNDFTGVEIQPSVRLLYHPVENHVVWTSVARAVRTPSRREDDLLSSFTDVEEDFTSVPPVRLTSSGVSSGNKDLNSEELIAYELGYRFQARHNLTLDFAAFYNDYSNLIIDFDTMVGPSIFTGFNPPFFDFAADIEIRNNGRAHGETYGMEIAADWSPLDVWHLSANYSWLDIQLHTRNRPPPRGGSSKEVIIEKLSPHHQANLRSLIDLPWNLELDVALFYVDAVFGDFTREATRINVMLLPSYIRLNIRLGWRPTDRLEISLVAQDILDDRHPESGSAEANEGPEPSEVERSIFGKIAWRF